jgi:hypothetical protein
VLGARHVGYEVRVADYQVFGALAAAYGSARP